MLMRFFSVLFILLLLDGCARVSQNHKVVRPEPKITTETRQQPSFNEVRVHGKLNVDLQTGNAKPAVILHGDTRDLAALKTIVKNNTLFVKFKDGYPRFGAVTAKIQSMHLNAFTYKGYGTISGNNLKTGFFDVNIKNAGEAKLGGSVFLRSVRVSGGGSTQISGINSDSLLVSIADKTNLQLVGVINLSKLNLNGKGQLSMYWVRSNHLIVCGRGQILMQLAGVVDKLEVELWDRAHFKGRYLRAKNVFVKTHGRSIADISAVRHQHTLATDSSNIYFYKVPRTKADFMAFEGSVLDLRDWHRNDLRDFDRYNKEP